MPMMSPPEKAGDPESSDAANLGTPQATTAKMMEPPSMSKQSWYGKSDVDKVAASAAHPALKTFPIPTTT
jgi:hypothetical protein